LHICNKTNHTLNTKTDIILADHIWWNVSIRFWITDSCFGISINHNTAFNWPKAIVNETQAIKPCNAVAGIRVTYFVRRSNQIINDRAATTNASKGKYHTSCIAE
jgi:hypothetical protein